MFLFWYPTVASTVFLDQWSTLHKHQAVLMIPPTLMTMCLYTIHTFKWLVYIDYPRAHYTAILNWYTIGLILYSSGLHCINILGYYTCTMQVCLPGLYQSVIATACSQLWHIKGQNEAKSEKAWLIISYVCTHILVYLNYIKQCHNNKVYMYLASQALS